MPYAPDMQNMPKAASVKSALALFTSMPMAPAYVDKAKALLNAGYSVAFGFNSVQMTSPSGGKECTVTLPALVAVLMDSPKNLSSAQKIVCGKALVKLLNHFDESSEPKGGEEAQGLATVTIPLDTDMLEVNGTITMAQAGELSSGVGPLGQDSDADTSLHTAVGELKKATALMGFVKGSDEGSVYRVIAGDFSSTLGLRIGAKINTKQKVMSIRVEGLLTPAQKTSLSECGMKWSAHHGSVHYKLGSIYPARVLGAILADDRLCPLVTLDQNGIKGFLVSQKWEGA